MTELVVEKQQQIVKYLEAIVTHFIMILNEFWQFVNNALENLHFWLNFLLDKQFTENF
jgi:hypothetical protein